MHCRPSIEPRPVLALQHNQLAATNDSVQRFQYLSKPLGFRVVGAVGFLLTWKTETQKKLSGIETKQKNHLWEKEGHPDKKEFIRLRNFLSRFDSSETNLFVFCRFRFRGKSEKMDDVGIDQNRENINLWRRQKKFSASSQKKPKKNSSFKIKNPGSKKTFFWVKKNLWRFDDGDVFRSQDAWNKASLSGSRALVA